MSEVKHTPTPWEVSGALCGEHDTETVSIYHYPDSGSVVEVVETGCRFGDEALSEANARHIVKSANYHHRLVEALRECAIQLDDRRATSRCMDNIVSDSAWRLLAELDHD